MTFLDAIGSIVLPTGAVVCSTYALARIKRHRRQLARALARAGRRHRPLLVPVAILPPDAAVSFLRPGPEEESAGPDRTPRPMRFLIDSLVLGISFRRVCRPGTMEPFREVFHYASGLAVDGQTFVISHVVQPDFAEQSAGGVRVDDSSNIRTLTWLDEVGLPLVAHFHSHPGFGPQGTVPSLTDRRFQERLERGGHVCIGGIFSRDGYVRFFAGDPNRFEVSVQGRQVEKVEGYDHVYRIPLADGLVSLDPPDGG